MDEDRPTQTELQCAIEAIRHHAKRFGACYSPGVIAVLVRGERLLRDLGAWVGLLKRQHRRMRARFDLTSTTTVNTHGEEGSHYVLRMLARCFAMQRQMHAAERRVVEFAKELKDA